MGIVAEPVQAKNTACECHKIDDELICWSKGVIGALSDSQENSLCTVKNVSSMSKDYQSHIKKFKEMSEISDKCLEEEVEDTWACVEKEAQKKQ